MRGAIAPPQVPIARSRAEMFDDLVLDAVEDIEQSWASEVSQVDFAVEEVPVAVAGGDAGLEFDSGVVADRGVALGRLYRVGEIMTDDQAAEKPVIVLYRRPIEARTGEAGDRGDLVFAIVAELVAELLGKDIDDIDP
jgi:predicted Zn-dependent protease with MMP-like domain